MTIFILKYAGTFLVMTLPQHIMRFSALTAAQYMELFWGLLLTVSVFLMLIRFFKQLLSVISIIRSYITKFNLS